VEAASELSLVLRSQPQMTSAWFLYGIAAAAQGKLDDAAAAFLRSHAAESGLGPGTVSLGRNPEPAGKNLKRRSQHYREALRLKPDFPEALNALAFILATNPNAKSFVMGFEASQVAEPSLCFKATTRNRQ